MIYDEDFIDTVVPMLEYLEEPTVVERTGISDEELAFDEADTVLLFFYETRARR
jgi:hypothetical protein